jgi:hypothetical protein
MFPVTLDTKLLASSLSLRGNSNTLPWYWFVPDRIVAFTVYPAERPYSAEKLLVLTLNSCTASTEGM